MVVKELNPYSAVKVMILVLVYSVYGRAGTSAGFRNGAVTLIGQQKVNKAVSADGGSCCFVK